MFSLQEFYKYLKSKNRIGIFSFFLALIINIFFFVFLDLGKYKIFWLFSLILIYVITSYSVEKIIYNKYLKKQTDLISFIFYREYFGNKKKDINRQFTRKQIDDFIKNLDCGEYARKNEIPLEYFYIDNKDYTILKFEEEYLKHYTRTIPWENLIWKYSYTENDGFYENLEIEYTNEYNQVIKEDIITNRIEQKSSFQLFCLFVLYDLKYGKKSSLYRGYNMKRKFFVELDPFAGF